MKHACLLHMDDGVVARPSPRELERLDADSLACAAAEAEARP